MTSTSPLSQQRSTIQRPEEMDTTTPGPEDPEQKESMQVVVEALPDIESSHAHTLGAAVAGVKGKETETAGNDEESDDAGDNTSENESDNDGDTGRDVKRVKLDMNGEEVITASTQEQAQAGNSSDAHTEVTEAKAAEEEDEVFELRMTWAGQGFDLRVQGSDRLYDFKVCSVSSPSEVNTTANPFCLSLGDDLFSYCCSTGQAETYRSRQG